MTNFRVLTMVAILGCGKLLWAGYPTVWTVINTTGAQIYFECASSNLVPGTTIPTERLVLEPNTTQTYTWYSFYNGGQGLNPSDWHCVTGDNTRSSAGLRGETDIRTGLGEAVTLRIEQNQGTYRISKQ